MSWRDPSAIAEVIQGDEIGLGMAVSLAGLTCQCSGLAHFGDLRSMYIRALDQLAATAVRRPVDQPGRDVHGRYRYRIGPTCRRAFAAPAGDVVVEAVPAQPIIDLAVGRNALRSRDGRVNNQGAMLARLPEWLNLNGRGAER